MFICIQLSMKRAVLDTVVDDPSYVNSWAFIGYKSSLSIVHCWLSMEFIYKVDSLVASWRISGVANFPTEHFQLNFYEHASLLNRPRAPATKCIFVIRECSPTVFTHSTCRPRSATPWILSSIRFMFFPTIEMHSKRK